MKYLCAVLLTLASIYSVADGFFVTGIDNLNPFQMGLDLIGMGREVANRLAIRIQNRDIQYGAKIEPFFKTLIYRGPRANTNVQLEVKKTIGDFEVRPGFPFGRSVPIPKVDFKKNIVAGSPRYQNKRPNYFDKYYRKGYDLGKTLHLNRGPLKFSVKKYLGMPVWRY